MQNNVRLVAGGVYLTFAMITLIFLMPASLFLHSEVENSRENISITIDNITVDWLNSTHAQYVRIEFAVSNPSSSLIVDILDMKVLTANLNEDEITLLLTNNIFVDINKAVNPGETLIFSLTRNYAYNYKNDNNLLYENKLKNLDWNWFFHMQFRGRIGEQENLFIEAEFEVSGVVNTGNP